MNNVRIITTRKETGDRMEERKDEVCDGFEVHEDLLKIVNETLPEETELYDPVSYTHLTLPTRWSV